MKTMTTKNPAAVALGSIKSPAKSAAARENGRKGGRPSRAELAERAIVQLHALSRDDPEEAHARADNILLEFLSATGGKGVADAFLRAQDRVGFWYA